MLDKYNCIQSIEYSETEEKHSDEDIENGEQKETSYSDDEIIL